MKIVIKKEDIEIAFYNNKKAGGQHANSQKNGVQLKHLPTGIIARCQDSRDRPANYKSAIKVLVVRLNAYYNKLQEDEKEKNKTPNDLVIRTYNAKRSQAKCHRTGKCVKFSSDNTYILTPEDLDELIEENIKLDIQKGKE